MAFTIQRFYESGRVSVDVVVHNGAVARLQISVTEDDGSFRSLYIDVDQLGEFTEVLRRAVELAAQWDRVH